MDPHKWIDIQDTPLMYVNKFLGVVYDNLHTFKQHADYLKTRVKLRNIVLKSLAGTTWGMEKETLLATYKSISQLVLNYCSPIKKQIGKLLKMKLSEHL